MIVSCPVCVTRFDVDPAALGPSGRKVRCVRCAHVWHQEADGTTAAIFAPIEQASSRTFAETDPLPNFMMETSVTVEPEPPEEDLAFVFAKRPPPAKVKKPRDVVTPLAWSALLAALILICVLAIFGRENIVQRWPRLNAVYAEIGLPAEPIGAGLELRGINSAIVPANGKLSLIVAGEVANVSSIPRSVPSLTIHLRDGANKIITSWTISPRPGKLPPGETMPFQTSMATPPVGASSAVVTFQP